MDGNFKAEHMHPVNPSDEVSLMDGLGFMVSTERYKSHLVIARDHVQRSDCNNHQAVNLAKCLTAKAGGHQYRRMCMCTAWMFSSHIPWWTFRKAKGQYILHLVISMADVTHCVITYDLPQECDS
jgi:hypothetical protein